MTGFLALFFVLLQVNTVPALPTTPLEPAPSPSGPRTSTTTTGGTTVVNVMPATDEEIAHDASVAAPAGMDGGASALAKGANTLARQSLALPNYLVTRDKNTILHNPSVLTLNDSLRFVGLAIWFICLLLIIAKHLAGPFVGADIMDLSYALPVGIFMGLLGWFNQILLSAIIDVVGGVISSVVAAPLSEAITPGLSFNTATSLIIAPILGVFYDLMALWLIFKLWLQIAWLWMLTAAAPIYITMTGAPFLGKYGSHWWNSWFGTLIDPVLVVIGLKLIVPWFDLLKGSPELANQLAHGVTLFVIAASIGWHPGAFKPRSPELVLAALVMRALKAHSQRQNTPAPAAPPPPPLPQPPNNPHAISGQGAGQWIMPATGTGGGTAASWWKTRQWAVNP